MNTGSAESTGAYFGEALLKETVVKEALRHEREDLLRQRYGFWREDLNGVMRGCSIGCLVHPDETAVDEEEIREAVAGHFNWPADLVCAQEAVFEYSPVAYAMSWTGRWVEAIPVGADLSGVREEYGEWLIARGETREAIYLSSFPALGDKMIEIVKSLDPNPIEDTEISQRYINEVYAGVVA